jgi:hypothetical protein
MSQEDEAYALAHFGVKGMHWGQRKERPNHPLTSTQKKILAVGVAGTAGTALIGSAPLVVGAVAIGTGAAYVNSRRTQAATSLSSQASGKTFVEKSAKSKVK